MARSTRTKRSTTKPLGKNFADHQAVNHGDGEYARGATTTNTVERFFGVFKGGWSAFISTVARNRVAMGIELRWVCGGCFV